MNKIFEVEIGRPGSIGAMTATSLSLPATPFVLADALAKAHITDERIIYSTEVLDSNCSYLPSLIAASANIYELNYLAKRLAALTEWELDCFEGLVEMDAARGAESIPVDRLINFTYSLWRLSTHAQFGGTWLSDYVPNRLGGFVQEQQSQAKPDCPLIGADGNVFNLMGIAARTLKENGLAEQAKEMRERITTCGSYDETLGIIGQYVNIISVNEEQSSGFEMTQQF